MHSEYVISQSGIGQAERHVLEVISRIGKPVTRADDLEDELGFSRDVSNLMLSRLCRKGWLQRLRSGVYRIVPLGSESTNPVPEDAWAIAVALFSPCYISGWTAAEHWDLTEQIFNSTVIFTVHKQRNKEVLISGLKYRTRLVSPDNIFGTKKIWSSNVQIQIADIHRTIIDALDDPEIIGGARHMLDVLKEYFKHKDASPEILYQYAEKLGHGAVFKRLGFIAENLKKFSPQLLDKLHSNINKGVIKLDPHGPNTGPIVTKWGVRLNIPLGDIA